MIIGHQRILDFLKSSIKKNKISHAYLFYGPANIGKKKVALEFVRILIGQDAENTMHPDVLIVEPEIEEKKGVKKELEISIDQARQIRRQISLSAHHAPYKIVIIDGVEKMTRQAANALLKTLEEPLGRTVIILLCSNLQQVLPTIISRCQLIKFLPVPNLEIEKILFKSYKADASDFKKIIRLACGRPGLVINYLTNPALLKEQDQLLADIENLIKADLNSRYLYIEKIAKDISGARYILNTWLLWFRDLALLSCGCQDLIINQKTASFKHQYSLNQIKNIIQSIKKTDYMLQNPSINSRLALEVLMLGF